jgi:hypothetical protein
LKRHLYIPDCQVKPGVPLDHLTWCGKYIVKMKPDVIILAGDFADMESLCSYDKGTKSYEGRRYQADVAVTREAMSLLLNPIKVYNEEAKQNHRPRYKPRRVFTLGNHEDRISRAIESDPKLDGLISIDDLGYSECGWEVYPFLQPVTIDGIVYSHYFPSGQLGRPCTSAKAILAKHHMSCVAGHQQGRDIAYGKRADGTEITAIISGSFYQHNEAYLNPQTNNHWRGIWVFHEVDNGSFDEMPVSLSYLRKKYS